MRALLFCSVSGHVLVDAHRPVLVVGLHADVRGATAAPVRISAVDDSAAADAAVPEIAAWQQTFGGPAVQPVDVTPLAVTVGPAAGDWNSSSSAESTRRARR
jgi:hypothetical protein